MSHFLVLKNGAFNKNKDKNEDIALIFLKHMQIDIHDSPHLFYANSM